MATVRTGGYQHATRSGGPSETAKAVEALFETQTVVEIREVDSLCCNVLQLLTGFPFLNNLTSIGGNENSN